MKVDTTDRPSWGWMMEFYIRPEHRRRGYGRRLPSSPLLWHRPNPPMRSPIADGSERL